MRLKDFFKDILEIISFEPRLFIRSKVRVAHIYNPSTWNGDRRIGSFQGDVATYMLRGRGRGGIGGRRGEGRGSGEGRGEEEEEGGKEEKEENEVILLDGWKCVLEAMVERL